MDQDESANTSSPGPSSFYDHNGHQMRTTPAAFGQPQPSHASYYTHGPTQAYGAPMGYYQQPIHNHRAEPLGYSAGYDRRRGYDDLNDFFGQAKRRSLDPASYNQVGRSLMPLHGALSVHTGGIGTQYMTAAPPALPAIAGQPSSQSALDQHYYLPPMPNLRTKGDLEQIDQILEQMQSTVYENSGSPSSSHYPSTFDLRHQSPVSRDNVGSAHYAVSAAQMPSPLSAVSSTTSGSVAHTPPSTTMSYTAGQSPASTAAGMSPGTRHSSSASVAYPSLPATTSYGSSTISLGSTFATNDQRRLSGGMLQRASGARRSSEEPAGGATTPKAAEPESPASPSEDGDASGEPESYETWLQNIRVIEFLREAIRDRLENGQFDADSEGEDNIDPSLKEAEAAAKNDGPLYPALPMEVDE